MTGLHRTAPVGCNRDGSGRNRPERGGRSERMKPIIMSTEDVWAILDGRKTMARRVVKPQPTYWDDGERVYDKDSIMGPEFYAPVRVDKNGEQYPGKEVYGIYSDDGEYGCKAPYQPGDVLWVRETWEGLNENEYLYQADDPDVNVWKIRRSKGVGVVHNRWCSPATMPREAARLFLRVTGVRVEKNEDSGQWVWVIEFERVEKGEES